MLISHIAKLWMTCLLSLFMLHSSVDEAQPLLEGLVEGHHLCWREVNWRRVWWIADQMIIEAQFRDREDGSLAHHGIQLRDISREYDVVEKEIDRHPKF